MSLSSDAPCPATNTAPAITRDSIRDDLIALGARPGDVLYVRCGLARVGMRARDAAEIFLGGMRDAIGPSGTIVAPAFTEVSFRWNKPIATFSLDTPPTTGAFSKVLLGQPDAVRSAHPTHSFVALGSRATEILQHHPTDGASFEPIRRIVAADGLMLLIGCVADSPGFSTVHLAQYDLGLSQRHHVRHLLAVGLPDGSRFTPVESPGCSRNFGAFYRHYIEAGNFVAGNVGKAWSIAVRAAQAYACERDTLARNPRFPVCDVPDCLSCRITRGYNKRAISAALLHRLRRLVSHRA